MCQDFQETRNPPPKMLVQLHARSSAEVLRKAGRRARERQLHKRQVWSIKLSEVYKTMHLPNLEADIRLQMQRIRSPVIELVGALHILDAVCMFTIPPPR